MVKLLVALLAFAVVPVTDDKSIEVINRRPSSIIENIKQLVPNSVTVEADDLGSKIKLAGPSESIAQVIRMISLFDVKSRSLRINWAYVHIVDKIELNGFANIRNNSKFMFVESDSDTTVTLLPRLNEDATLTSNVQFEWKKAKFQIERKTIREEQFIVQIPDMEPINDEARKALKDVDKRMWPRLTFKLAVNETRN